MLWLWQTQSSQPRLSRQKETLVPIHVPAPQSYSPPKKMGAKELYTHIRSITALMSEDEKEEFYQEAEKEGF